MSDFAMTGNMKLDVYSRVLSIVCLLCIEEIIAVEWKNTSFQLKYTLASLPNSMLLNETLVSEQRNATTVISCSRYCAKTEQHSLYYNKKEGICYCNNDIDTRLTPVNTTVDDSPSDIEYGYTVASLQVSTNSSTLKYNIQPYTENCFALYHQGYMTNAVYTVRPIEGSIQDTYCDMDNVLDVGADDCLQWHQAGYKDDGVYSICLSNGTTVRAWCDQTRGGWTVFQRRQDGSVDFFRTWAEYVNGFGDAAGEYWLGLEAIYLLSQQRSLLRIYMEAFEGVEPPTAYASYGEFSLASATDKYRLSIGDFTGDCGDSLAHHNQQQFSTRDSDNDRHPSLWCSQSRKGAWWYNRCLDSNLNSLYREGNYTSNVPDGIVWETCWRWKVLKTCSMEIKRN